MSCKWVNRNMVRNPAQRRKTNALIIFFLRAIHHRSHSRFSHYETNVTLLAVTRITVTKGLQSKGHSAHGYGDVDAKIPIVGKELKRQHFNRSTRVVQHYLSNACIKDKTIRIHDSGADAFMNWPERAHVRNEIKLRKEYLIEETQSCFRLCTSE